MLQLTIIDQYNTYTRISKAAAKKRFFTGQPIYIIGHKLRPGRPFSMGCTIDNKAWMEQADRYDPQKQPAGSIYSPTCVSSLWKGSREETAWCLMYNNWAYYNANHECGMYAAYYIEEPVKGENSVVN